MRNCPLGTYLPYRGALSDAECLECGAGKYCDQVGAAEEAGKERLVGKLIYSLALIRAMVR